MTPSSKLHIAHVQGIFSPEHGGPTYSLANYCRGQVAAGLRVSVRVLEGYPHTTPALRLASPVDMAVCRVGFPSKLGASTELRRRLRQDPTPDIYHLHGVWLLAMHYGAQEARRRRTPYVVELMGAYETYARRQKWLRKWISRKLFQDNLLRRAGCLHAGSANEARDLRALGFRTPIAVIPVGVDTGRIAGNAGEARAGWTDGPFLLYLARLHQKKGIELLLRVWAELAGRYPDYRLMIAGSGAPEYVDHCKRLAEELGIQDRCEWLGQVSESEKSWLYRHADAYVLPTYSENFGNTVAEALAHGTPVITTTQTPWTDLPQQGCGWIAEPTVASLRTAIGEALEASPSRCQGMGAKGRQLVEERYSLASVIERMDRMYGWLLGGPRPDDLLF